MKPWDLWWGRKGAARVGALSAVAACVAVASFAGCGGGGAAPAAEDVQPTSCTVGASALPFMPEAPGWWTEGPGPTLALACLHDRATGNAMIVGYSSPESTGGHCMNAYNLRLQWSAGEKCAKPGVPWTYWCEGAEGCIKGFGYEKGVTGMMGLLSAAVDDVRVLVDGKPLTKGVAVAHVRGRTIHEIGAEEPFGFFMAFVPRCVPPGKVQVELLDASGSRIGAARGWRAPMTCPRGA